MIFVRIKQYAAQRNRQRVDRSQERQKKYGYSTGTVKKNKKLSNRTRGGGGKTEGSRKET